MLERTAAWASSSSAACCSDTELHGARSVGRLPSARLPHSAARRRGPALFETIFRSGRSQTMILRADFPEDRRAAISWQYLRSPPASTFPVLLAAGTRTLHRRFDVKQSRLDYPHGLEQFGADQPWLQSMAAASEDWGCWDSIAPASCVFYRAGQCAGIH